MTPWRKRDSKEPPEPLVGSSDADVEAWLGGDVPISHSASSVAMPLNPKEFVELLAAELGTESAVWLLLKALGIVQDAENPDRWIVEVRRAQQRGDLSSAVADYLIYELAEAVTRGLTITHPLLSSLEAQMERIERQHGFAEDEYWRVDEGPPEWQALDREWGALYDELLMDVLLRNGESEIAEAYSIGDEGRYKVGWRLMIGA